MWFKCVGPVENSGPQITPKDFCKFTINEGIKIPLIHERDTDKIEIEFYHKILPKSNQGIIGYPYLWNGNTGYCLFTIIIASQVPYYKIFNTQLSNYTVTLGYHKLEYNSSDGSVVIDGTEVATGIYPPSGMPIISYVLNCMLINPAANTAPQNPSDVLIKRFKVTNISTGVVRADITPCNINGVNSLYDSVTNKIFTSNRLYCSSQSTQNRVRIVTKSVGGSDASITLELYDSDDVTLLDTEDVLYTSVPNEASAFEFGPIKLWYNSRWYLKAIDSLMYIYSNTINTFENTDDILNWTYNSNIERDVYFDNPT